MLIKVAVNPTARRDVLDIANIFRAKAVDVSDHTITLQVYNFPVFESAQFLVYFLGDSVSRFRHCSILNRSFL